MSSGYVIAQVEITNAVQYEEYKKWSSAAMQAHNAEVCVRGGTVEILEGKWPPARMVVLKFSSFEKAKAFYNTPEYLRAREARAGAAIMNMIAVEGV